jgi:predicted aspartyl protease
VVLDTVTVGGITLHNIKGAVIVADSGPEILLGMSFLSQTEMHEDNNTLVLRKKF